MLSDTSPAAERVWIGWWRQATPEQRLARALAATARSLAASRRAIADARPGLSPRERDLLWIEVHYGRDLANRLARHLHGG